MNKKNIIIVYGGKSVEHSVSINSAKNVYQYIDKSLFNAICIGVSRNGAWYLTQDITSNITSGKPVEIVLAPTIQFHVDGNPLKVDMIFPLIHGTNGEDGSIQGLFQVMDIPFVGCGVLGSAVNMSKLTTKKILKESGIPVIKFLYFQKNEGDSIVFEEIEKELGLPFIVKAANLGSSVGISKVNEKKDFEPAIDLAFKYDQQLLIEKFVTAREVECAVLGNHTPEASNPGEIVISDQYAFYDFKAKYVDETAVKIEVPAQIEPEIINRIKSLCEKAYIVLECEDYARVDLFLTNKGDIFINEINSIPGFTNASMFPMMWKEKGISFTQLITKLINIAFDRYEFKKDINTDYFSELDSL
ncbi:MAG: D-alanine--D-alanine ligase [Cyclobacteriaceae bacterium]|nr:D-alanine--D-alanine ligase [Cyclobacteriaceae bacterium]